MAKIMDDDLSRPPEFRPTIPPVARMTRLSEAVAEAADAILEHDEDAVRRAFAVPTSGTEQRYMLMCAASMMVVFMQELAAERGAVAPNTFALEGMAEDEPTGLAAAMMNAMSTGDGDALVSLMFTSDLPVVVRATLVLVSALVKADDAVFTDGHGNVSGGH